MNKTKKRIIAVTAAIMMACASFGGQVSADKWIGSTEHGFKYQYEDGTYAEKGWLTCGDKKYYIQSDGTRKTGWMETKSGNKYYFNSKGVMLTGWVRFGEDKYYFAEDGIMVTGVLSKGNKTYYFYEDGVLYKTVTEKKHKRIVTTTYTTVETITEYANGESSSVFSDPEKTVETKYE